MSIPDRLVAALADRYRIERELGAGGMATVYLAEDLKHNRKVAVKVLKPELAAVLGAERFVVEIKTTAALQHPHILPLFDSGTADGFLFYVMPFIQGETLRDKLSRETQLGVDEAVRVTREIADALHYAHTQGVIHRDIKPENILLANGRPMVADFGIALAVSAAAGGRMTETGLSLGTPHYMSPEQATAEKEITGRSDIYSLASVCYEMLTGNPPHVGSSAQQIIMKIITEQAQPVTQFRKSVPPHVAAAVAKALEKLPADRFESAEKFAEALANPSFTTLTAAALPVATRGSRAALIGVSAIAIVAMATAAWLASRPAPQPPLLQYRLTMPDSQAPVPMSGVPVLAPDGSYMIYRGPVLGTVTASQLWIKRRESLDAMPISGTRDAGFVSVSPDGKRIAFEYGGSLRVLPVSGGSPNILLSGREGTLVQPMPVTWLDDETLVFAGTTAAEPNIPELFAIPAAGGEVRTLGLRDGDRAAVIPTAINGRNALLYLSCVTQLECDLRAHDLRSGKSKTLVLGSFFGAYSASGHLLYERGGALMASRFDADKLSLQGEVVGLRDRLQVSLLLPLSLAEDGTMVQLTGNGDLAGLTHELVWVDRSGRQELLDPDMPPVRMLFTGVNHGWSLSPDGTRLAIGLNTDAGDNVWVKQLPRGALTRVTFSSNPEYRPRWAPDGRSLVFISPSDIRTRRPDGTGTDSVLTRWQGNEAQFSPDGKWLVARGGAGGSVVGGRDIFAMRLGTDTIPRPLLASPTYDETAPMLSPDGRWLLYQSDESGRNEIYLRPFPDVDRLRIQVSVGGGETPLWSRNGRELYFVSTDRQMMAADFAAGDTPRVGAPRALFTIPAALLDVETAFYTPWDIAADGRFLMARSTSGRSGNRSEIVVTHNVFTELNRRVPRQ